MRHWDKLDTRIHKGFDIRIDTSYEEIHPRDLFDDACHDIDEICRKIDAGIYEWFMVRVRAMIDDVELSSAYLGGCLYDSREQFLEDCVLEDLIDEAVFQAGIRAKSLTKKLVDIVVQ
jgi:hypothetical protein